MSTYTILVTVEVERESGLHASRDEVMDKLADAIEESLNSADLSGLGPRADSEYSASDASIEFLDKKSERQTMQEHDAAVVADYPGDAALRKQIREAHAEQTKAEREAEKLRNLLKAERDNREIKSSRVWMGGSWDDDKKTYLPDGVHDHVYFRYGSRDDERFTVVFTHNNELEIRGDSGFYGFAVRPMSGNVINVVALERR